VDYINAKSHDFELRGIVIFEYAYTIKSGFPSERMHAFESSICALFGLYDPGMMMNDLWGPQMTEMFFCPLFDGLAAESELLTPNMVNEAVSALGAGVGYLGANKLMPSLEPVVCGIPAHIRMLSRYGYLIAVNGGKATLPTWAHWTSGGDKSFTLNASMEGIDLDCKKVRLKVEMSKNSNPHPHCLFGSTIDLPTTYVPEASRQFAIRAYPEDVDKWHT